MYIDTDGNWIAKYKLKSRERMYVAPATAVVVAGAFNEAKVIAMAKKIFGGLPVKPKTKLVPTKEAQTKPQALLKLKESDQTHIVLGARAFSMFDERRYALGVLAEVLGGGMSSRLFHRLREDLGAAYYVRASNDLSLDHGVFQVSAGIDNARAAEVIGVIVDEFRTLTKKLVPPAELKKSKDHMTGSLLIGLETSDEVAGFYGDQEVLIGKLRGPREIVKKIEAVTAEQIRAVAKFCFRPEKLNLATIGPLKDEKTLLAKMVL
jgi:predicted Zn-dependent peptidase